MNKEEIIKLLVAKQGYTKSQAIAVANMMDKKVAQQGYEKQKYAQQAQYPYFQNGWQQAVGVSTQDPYNYPSNASTEDFNIDTSGYELEQSKKDLAYLKNKRAGLETQLPINYGQKKESEYDINNYNPTGDFTNQGSQNQGDVNILNPFSGVSLENSINMLGQGIGSKDPWKTGMAGSAALLKLGRAGLSGYASGKSDRDSSENYYKKLFEDQRKTEMLQQGGIKNSKVMAMNAVTDNPGGNINLEGGEYVKRANGAVQPVVGAKHIENGKKSEGVDATLEDGDKVLSDYIKLRPLDIKELKERYNITLKKGDTPAKALSKIEAKIGLKKETDELATLAEKLEKTLSIKDITTRELNTEVLQNKIGDKNEKINSLKEVSTFAFEELFELQEQQPKKGDGTQLYDNNGKEVTETNEGVAQQGGEKNSLWKNIRDNRGSGKSPTKEMLEQEAKIKRSAQQGEEQGGQDQAMQIIQAYAQASGQDPEEIMQQLQQMQPEEQQQAIQQMMQELQGGQGQEAEMQNPQEQQEMMAQQGGMMEIASKYGISPERAQQLMSMQQGGMQSQQEEMQEGQMSNPQEEQGEMAPEEIFQMVAQALQSGADPNEVAQQLLQMGVPQEAIQQIIQEVVGQLQGQPEQMEGQMPQEQEMGQLMQQGGKKMYAQQAPFSNPLLQPNSRFINPLQPNSIQNLQPTINPNGLGQIPNWNYVAPTAQPRVTGNIGTNTKPFVQRFNLADFVLDTPTTNAPQPTTQVAGTPQQNEDFYSFAVKASTPKVAGYDITSTGILNQDTLGGVEKIQKYKEGVGHGDKMAAAEETIKLHKWYFDTDEKKKAFLEASKKRGTQPEVLSFQKAYDVETARIGKEAGMTDEQIKELIQQVGFTGEGVKKKDGTFGAFSSTRPLIEAKKQAADAKPAEDNAEADNVAVDGQTNNTRNIMPQFPVDLRLTPSGIPSLLRSQVNLGRLDPIKQTVEPYLAEQARQAMTARQQMTATGLPPQMQEALLGQQLATTQLSANDAISKTENFNRQNQFQTDQFNIGQRAKEEITNEQFSQDYQTKMLGSMANTERDWRNYYTEGNLQNRADYQSVENANLLNAMSENYNYIPGQGTQYTNRQSTDLGRKNRTQEWLDNATPEELEKAKKEDVERINLNKKKTANKKQ